MVFISNKIEVRDSLTHGRGVFAKEDISEGEIIENCHFTILEQPFLSIDKKLQEYVFAWPKTSFASKSVVVWGSGKDLGSYTVSSGSITLSEAVTSCIVGLSYTAQYKSMKLAYASQSPLNQVKRINQ